MKKRIDGAATPLERHVQKWINSRAADYESGAEGVLKDLFYGGCQSGMVGHLIYYTDTLEFFKKYRQEINALLVEALESSGCSISELFGDKWEKEDPLAQDRLNQNLLAWFGFEETARKLADANEIEV